MMTDKNKKYCLALLANDKYVDYCYCLILSFVRNNKWFNGDIIIMQNDKIRLSEENKAKLSKLYNNISFKNFDINIDDFIEKHTNIYKNVHDGRLNWLNACYKISLFGIVGYDKVVYIDTDCIVNSDISELFKSDYDILACRNNIENFDLTDSDFDDKTYINTGVFSINGKLLSNELLKECIKTANEEIFDESDQSLINALFKKMNCTKKVLNSRFNTNIYEGSRPSLFSEVDDIKIFHFWNKPIDENGKIKNNIPTIPASVFLRYYIELNTKKTNLVYTVIDSVNALKNAKMMFDSIKEDNFDKLILTNSEDVYNEIKSHNDLYCIFCGNEKNVTLLKYSEIIPQCYDYYIYLDSDILIFGSLNELIGKYNDFDLLYVDEDLNITEQWFDYSKACDVKNKNCKGKNCGQFVYTNNFKKYLNKEFKKILPFFKKSYETDHFIDQRVFNYFVIENGDEYNLYNFGEDVRLKATEETQPKTVNHFNYYFGETMLKNLKMTLFYDKYLIDILSRLKT